MNNIGVGIIGASPRSGWAAMAHVPALSHVPGLALRAVATSRVDSAAEAERVFGVPAYADPDSLLRDPAVDLVVVAVNVAKHHELVRRAIDAGKNVLCEWPLGVTTEEAADLAARAHASGVRTFVGLQARYAPAVAKMRELVAGGYIGEVFASTLVASGEFWGPEIADASRYVFDRTKGATMVQASAMHALDATMSALGEIRDLTATVATRRERVRIAGTEETFVPTAPDHVALQGTLESGAVFSSFHRGGHSRGENFRWEVNGSDGDLAITSASGYVQHAPLVLWGGRGADRTLGPIALAEGALEGPPANIARLYAAIARDVREGSHAVPDFALAVRRHRLVDAIMSVPAR